MGSAKLEWYSDPDSLLGELRRSGFGPAEAPTIPGYEDLRELGRGGQGVVFSAIQRSTKRRVAVKILREQAFGTSTMRRRFEREIDLVAGLRHSNVISIHDSGTTHDGRLYFVMEFIDGVALDQFVAKAKTDRNRVASASWLLELFSRICQAINHAHQRGVIHRDLKPGNILVDKAGEPHVCDFGLAKAVVDTPAEQGAAGNMSVTGQFMGSLPWASPEQLEASHSRVDVRSDVYSLGVILYQMLTGQLPHDSGGGLRQVVDRIMHQEPPAPSRLTPLADDEIDTIVMKCLAKESLRRYQSVAELLADVRHYLAGEPIAAKRDSTWYTLRKSLRRHRIVASAGGVVLIVVAVALVVSLTSWREATVALEQAKREAAQRAAIGGFLERMLVSVDPGRDGREVRMMEVLDKAATEISTSLKDQPLVEIQVRRTLSSSYSSLGLYEQAESQLRGAMQIANRELGDRDRRTLEATADLPWIIFQRGRLEEAEREGRSTLKIVEDILGAEDELRLRIAAVLGEILSLREKVGEAEGLLRSTLEMQTKRLGENHRDTLGTMSTLAVLLKRTNRYEEAESLFRRALRGQMAISGPRDPAALMIKSNLSLALQVQGKMDESESMQREAVEARKQVLGEDHPDTLASMSNLATLLLERRKLDEARSVLEQVAAIDEKTIGAEHHSTLTVKNNLAKVLQDIGKLPESEALFRSVLEARRRVMGEDHSHTLLTASNLAAVLEAVGKPEESLQLQRQVLDSRRRTLGENHLDTVISKNNLGMQLQKRGQLDEAAALLHQTCQPGAGGLSPDHYIIGLFHGNHGRCLMALERWQEAETELTRSCETLLKAFGADDKRTQQNIKSLVELLEKRGEHQKAVSWKARLATSQPTSEGAK